MKYYTRDIRPKKSFEDHSDESIVETAGYVPANIKIESLIQSGEKLKVFREEQFDFKPGEDIDDNFIDPTRKKNFDMAEASQMLQDLEDRAIVSNASKKALSEAPGHSDDGSEDIKDLKSDKLKEKAKNGNLESADESNKSD